MTVTTTSGLLQGSRHTNTKIRKAVALDVNAVLDLVRVFASVAELKAFIARHLDTDLTTLPADQATALQGLRTITRCVQLGEALEMPIHLGAHVTGLVRRKLAEMGWAPAQVEAVLGLVRAACQATGGRTDLDVVPSQREAAALKNAHGITDDEDCAVIRMALAAKESAGTDEVLLVTADRELAKACNTGLVRQPAGRTITLATVPGVTAVSWTDLAARVAARAVELGG